MFQINRIIMEDIMWNIWSPMTDQPALNYNSGMGEQNNIEKIRILTP